MATDQEIGRMDAVTIADHVAAKRLSPVEVLDAALDRLDRLDPVLHAFTTVVPEEARRRAKRLETEIAAGHDVGPLAGVPTGVKDLICTKGIRTASGSHAYADFVPDENDVVVERIEAAGAIVIGKTQVPEFGYSGTGQTPLAEPTCNPWNLDRTSGGSSAGTGAAVATGIGPFSLGSDGGGSVRIPASFCGLYGIKATMGRVPLYPGTKDERYPGVSSWESLEHIGPLTRTVADAALVLSVIAGHDDRDRLSIPSGDVDWRRAVEGDLRGVRIAYSPDLGYAAVDPQVRAVVDRAAEVFERDLGCVVERADPGWADPYESFWGAVINESDLVGLRRLADSLDDRMTPHLVEVLRSEWTAEQLTTAVMGRKAVYNAAWRFFRGYDLLLTPTLAVPAFEHGIQGPTVIDGREVEPFYWLSFTLPYNLTGQPAATVPAGFTTDGLPVGMQIIGRRLDDALVLRASAAFEAAAPWADRWPGLLDEMGL
ncbi:amidase [Pseudonocardia sp. H11422]|uniref:amidase n=1 Tax=Pseudonocardia sp. H11422 TaxID=2835866 RepID=UPI001BDD44EB|nr:amidase family protein [Pseudonocardia sp. H11422]